MATAAVQQQQVSPQSQQQDGTAEKLVPFKKTPGVCSSLRQISADAFYVVNEVVIKRLGPIPILKVRYLKFFTTISPE
jgi:hypothetical protein